MINCNSAAWLDPNFDELVIKP